MPAQKVYDAIGRIHDMLPRLAQVRESAQSAGDTALAQKIQGLAGAGGGGRGRGGRGGGGAAPASLSQTSSQLLALYGGTQEGSALPPTQTVAAVNAALAQYERLMVEADAIVKR